MTTLNKDVSLVVNEQAQKNLADIAEPVNYVPSIKITYQTSDHFAEGKAKLGDFFLDDQSLGNEIHVTALAYRYQAIALKKESSGFLESLVMGEGSIPFRETPEYLAFIKKYKDDTISYGIDILVYLPEHNLYGVLFCKKKLLKGGLKILELAGNNKVVSIKTVEKNWETKKWYELAITPLGRKIEAPSSEDKIEIYESQIITTMDKSDKKSTDNSGRKR